MMRQKGAGIVKMLLWCLCLVVSVVMPDGARAELVPYTLGGTTIMVDSSALGYNSPLLAFLRHGMPLRRGNSEEKQAEDVGNFDEQSHEEDISSSHIYSNQGGVFYEQAPEDISNPHLYSSQSGVTDDHKQEGTTIHHTYSSQGGGALDDQSQEDTSNSNINSNYGGSFYEQAQEDPSNYQTYNNQGGSFYAQRQDDTLGSHTNNNEGTSGALESDDESDEQFSSSHDFITNPNGGLSISVLDERRPVIPNIYQNPFVNRPTPITIDEAAGIYLEQEEVPTRTQPHTPPLYYAVETPDFNQVSQKIHKIVTSLNPKLNDRAPSPAGLGTLLSSTGQQPARPGDTPPVFTNTEGFTGVSVKHMVPEDPGAHDALVPNGEDVNTMVSSNPNPKHPLLLSDLPSRPFKQPESPSMPDPFPHVGDDWSHDHGPQLVYTYNTQEPVTNPQEPITETQEPFITTQESVTETIDAQEVLTNTNQSENKNSESQGNTGNQNNESQGNTVAQNNESQGNTASQNSESPGNTGSQNNESQANTASQNSESQGNTASQNNESQGNTVAQNNESQDNTANQNSESQGSTGNKNSELQESTINTKANSDTAADKESLADTTEKDSVDTTEKQYLPNSTDKPQSGADSTDTPQDQPDTTNKPESNTPTDTTEQTQTDKGNTNQPILTDAVIKQDHRVNTNENTPSDNNETTPEKGTTGANDKSGSEEASLTDNTAEITTPVNDQVTLEPYEENPSTTITPDIDLEEILLQKVVELKESEKIESLQDAQEKEDQEALDLAMADLLQSMFDPVTTPDTPTTSSEEEAVLGNTGDPKLDTTTAIPPEEVVDNVSPVGGGENETNSLSLPVPATPHQNTDTGNAQQPFVDIPLENIQVINPQEAFINSGSLEIDPEFGNEAVGQLFSSGNDGNESGGQLFSSGNGGNEGQSFSSGDDGNEASGQSFSSDDVGNEGGQSFSSGNVANDGGVDDPNSPLPPIHHDTFHHPTLLTNFPPARDEPGTIGRPVLYSPISLEEAAGVYINGQKVYIEGEVSPEEGEDVQATKLESPADNKHVYHTKFASPSELKNVHTTKIGSSTEEEHTQAIGNESPTEEANTFTIISGTSEDENTHAIKNESPIEENIFTIISGTSTEEENTHAIKNESATEEENIFTIISGTSTEEENTHPIKNQSPTDEEENIFTILSGTSTQEENTHVIKNQSPTEEENIFTILSGTFEEENTHSIGNDSPTEEENTFTILSGTSNEEENTHAIRNESPTEEENTFTIISGTSTEEENTHTIRNESPTEEENTFTIMSGTSTEEGNTHAIGNASPIEQEGGEEENTHATRNEPPVEQGSEEEANEGDEGEAHATRSDPPRPDDDDLNTWFNRDPISIFDPLHNPGPDSHLPGGISVSELTTEAGSTGDDSNAPGGTSGSEPVGGESQESSSIPGYGDSANVTDEVGAYSGGAFPGAVLHSARPDLFQKSSCRCGLRFSQKIVGGATTHVEQFPWMVALTNSHDDFSFCGGSIINDEYILTAAHCIYQKKPEQLYVLVGQSVRDTPSPIRVNVAKLIVHKGYTPTQVQTHDIGLLKLATPLEYNDRIFPVCLAEGKDSFAKENAVASGWGRNTFGGPVAQQLHEVTVGVMSTKDCRNDSLYHKTEVHKHIICAKAPGKDACQGDSGGPLVYLNGDHYMQIGLVSWGIGCAQENYPGIYTRISSYSRWISKQLRTFKGGRSCKGGIFRRRAGSKPKRRKNKRPNTTRVGAQGGEGGNVAGGGSGSGGGGNKLSPSSLVSLFSMEDLEDIESPGSGEDNNKKGEANRRPTDQHNKKNKKGGSGEIGSSQSGELDLILEDDIAIDILPQFSSDIDTTQGKRKNNNNRRNNKNKNKNQSGENNNSEETSSGESTTNNNNRNQNKGGGKRKNNKTGNRGGVETFSWELESDWSSIPEALEGIALEINKETKTD